MAKPAFGQNSSENQSRLGALSFGVKYGFHEPYELLCDDLLTGDMGFCLYLILKHLGT